MPVISYMGTKAALASDIARSLSNLTPGPLLDLFAGMATIGRAVAPTRNVWLNDVQQFSRLTSEVQFLNCDGASLRKAAYRTACRTFEKHCATLSTEYREQLEKEALALDKLDWATLASHAEDISSNTSVRLDVHHFHQKDYRLFVEIYASSYFGIRQCIELDALRKGIDHAAPAYNEKLAGVRRWMLAALGSAASRCSNSTGHFAQYLTASEMNVSRVVKQRRREILREWQASLRSMTQVGNYAWRKSNRIFNLDACNLLRDLNDSRMCPGVIYADPPYTSDQYSRYYHLLETLVLYDYPKVTGKGLYRPDRFVSSWSLKTKVRDSFETLIEQASQLGSSLVISYPTNGLLANSENVIPVMLSKHFRSHSRLTPRQHQHSTMGASKGNHRTDVTEQIFVASRAIS